MKLALIIPIAIIGIAVLGVGSIGIRYCNRVIQTAEQQLDPATLLRRYEWFKDLSSQLDKKLADIKIYEARFNQLKQDYLGKSRVDWPRSDREQYNLWVQELAGIQSSYNSLAAEYNAAMSKINYRFVNIGDLPSGASRALPREYREYSVGTAENAP